MKSCISTNWRKHIQIQQKKDASWIPMCKPSQCSPIPYVANSKSPPYTSDADNHSKIIIPDTIAGDAAPTLTIIFVEVARISILAFAYAVRICER